MWLEALWVGKYKYLYIYTFSLIPRPSRSHANSTCEFIYDVIRKSGGCDLDFYIIINYDMKHLLLTCAHRLGE